MTDQHPITPPPELVHKWALEAEDDHQPTVAYSLVGQIAAKAAQWGADQQLEATDTWIRTEMKDRQRPVNRIADDHRADMRPKPPSLKEQALHELNDVYNRDKIDDSTYDTICRALLAQPEQVAPTDEEIMELMPQQMRDDLAAAAYALAGFYRADPKAVGLIRITLNRHAVDHARAVLAKWGHQ